MTLERTVSMKLPIHNAPCSVLLFWLSPPKALLRAAVVVEEPFPPGCGVKFGTQSEPEKILGLNDSDLTQVAKYHTEAMFRPNVTQGIQYVVVGSPTYGKAYLYCEYEDRAP